MAEKELEQGSGLGGIATPGTGLTLLVIIDFVDTCDFLVQKSRPGQAGPGGSASHVVQIKVGLIST